MAGTPVVTSFSIGGRKYWRVTLSETSVGTATEWSADLQYGGAIELVRLGAQLTSGSGSTITPVLGRAASFTANSITEVAAVETAASNHSEGAHVTWWSDGSIYGRAVPDSGSDNAVSWEIILASGVG